MAAPDWLTVEQVSELSGHDREVLEELIWDGGVEAEPGSSEVAEDVAEADVVGTSLISRAEMAAALTEAVRMGTLTDEGATAAVSVIMLGVDAAHTMLATPSNP